MYFIAIVLPPDLNEKVLHWKNYMKEKYDCNTGLKSPAHITLVPPFWLDPQKEDLLLEDFRQLRSFEPFIAHTNNFSAFKPKTIFIAVAPNKQLHDLKMAVDHFFSNRTAYSVKTDSRPFHPHITIATRDLYKKDFYLAWPFFEGKKLEETWLVDSISLLRHNKKNWDVIYTSQFQKI
jgi:2'-5' RNA ligase